LFTLLASLTVLPAMYALHARVGDRLRKRRGGGEQPQPKPVRLAFPFLGAIGKLVQRAPWPALVVFVLITAGLGWAVRGAEFEGDMLNLLPQYKPSITLHRDILERFELNADYAMVTAPDVDSARPVVSKLKKNRLVGRVDAISELVPSEKQQRARRRIIEPLRERMAEIVEPRIAVGLPGGAAIAEVSGAALGEVSDEQAARFLEEIDRLQLNVEEIGQLAYTSVKKRLQRACDRLSGGEDRKFSMILDLKRRLAERDGLGREMGAYQEQYIPRLAAKLVRMGDTSPITVESLPDSIRDRYVSAEGNNLISVYAAVSLWDEGKTDLFLAATQKAATRVTGSVVLMDKLITLVGNRGLLATLLALGAVFLIMLVDFRHLGYAALGMTPLIAGFVWMVGLFVLTGRSFDVANVMAFPLILGIGIDDAVHVLHAIRRQGVSAMPEVLRHTGRALLLTSLTTGIAFGSIAFASHVGMAGIGQLLALGVASCFVASVVLLPALVRIFLGDKQSNDRIKEESHA
ncbi:MAG: MMPL family transporter, partial [Deltaproteobacteria bacterium]|nr:MMPL family transporter [Deltaproteobacteria bacterium]